VALKRKREAGTVEDERAALREQWAELEVLKQTLAERVRAVEERERELQALLRDANRDGSPLPPRPSQSADVVAAQAAELERRAAALGQRERDLAAREEALGVEGGSRGALPAAPVADERRLAELDARLAALKEAEAAFLRTQQELAARSDALTQRERLVSQRERELDEREDVADAQPEVAELEARLRKLEQQGAIPPARQPALEDTQGFSGGIKRLQEQGTRRPRS
jgi:DNA repair exonuclease SbcCD ATPase subunit